MATLSSEVAIKWLLFLNVGFKNEIMRKWSVFLRLGLLVSCHLALGQEVAPMPILSSKDSLQEHRITVWREWASLSEQELFKAYVLTEDTWLRMHVPSVLPIRVDEGTTRLTSGYGYRKHPISGTWKLHNGIDLSGSPYQPVYATAQGLVQQVSYDKSLGYYVVINHAGQFQTYYGHLATILVKPGQWVNREDCIGKVGRTGRATGYHLHYIIKRLGKTVDADKYLFLRYGLFPAKSTISSLRD